MRFFLAAAILVVLVIAGLWDLVIVFGSSGSPTISAVLVGWCRLWPPLPFALGFLLGHLLWPAAAP